METIKITTEYIKLDQFLKWAGIVGSGIDAKIMISEGLVKVNNVTEFQRGKKLRKGDIIEVNSKVFNVD